MAMRVSQNYPIPELITTSISHVLWIVIPVVRLRAGSDQFDPPSPHHLRQYVLYKRRFFL